MLRKINLKGFENLANIVKETAESKIKNTDINAKTIFKKGTEIVGKLSDMCEYITDEIINKSLVMTDKGEHYNTSLVFAGLDKSKISVKYDSIEDIIEIGIDDCCVPQSLKDSWSFTNKKAYIDLSELMYDKTKQPSITFENGVLSITVMKKVITTSSPEANNNINIEIK